MFRLEKQLKMPRTKQRKAVKQTGHEQFLRDFNRLMQLKMHNVAIDFKGLEMKFDASIDAALACYPTEIQNMTLGELLIPDATPVKENIPPKTSGMQRQSTMSKTKVMKSINSRESKNQKRVTAASDDGYQSECPSQASKHTSLSITQKSKKRSRSNSQDRKSKLKVRATMQKSHKDVQKTPSTKTSNTFVITPKIKLNSAINVLRKPKDGEMVFSTSGSPLLVSTTISDRTANINVPLMNGNIVSLLPFNETSFSENFNVDEETKHQLKILQSHLAKVLN